jgi:hypothetical protein
MSETSMRTFRCDSAGCKSYCEAPASVVDEATNLRNFLETRGWKVRGDKHLCPGHGGDWAGVPDTKEVASGEVEG